VGCRKGFRVTAEEVVEGTSRGLGVTHREGVEGTAGCA